MQFRTHRRREINLNLTPLIDVVFLLLIFFMVSTSFNRESQIQLDLPESNGAELETQPQQIEVSVAADGNIFINGNGLRNNELDTVRSALSKLINDQLKTPLIISADRQSPYQSVITVMDAAGQIGLNNIQLATVNPDKGS